MRLRYLEKEIIYFSLDSDKKTKLNLQKIYPKGKLDKEKAIELLDGND